MLGLQNQDSFAIDCWQKRKANSFHPTKQIIKKACQSTNSKCIYKNASTTIFAQLQKLLHNSYKKLHPTGRVIRKITLFCIT